MSKERKPYDRGKVLKLWEAGKSIEEIAESMKMSRVYAHRVLTTKYKAQYQAGVKERRDAREKAKGGK